MSGEGKENGKRPRRGEGQCCEAPCHVIALADGAPLVFCSLEMKAVFAAYFDRINSLSVQYADGFMHSEGTITASTLSAEDRVGYNWYVSGVRHRYAHTA